MGRGGFWGIISGLGISSSVTSKYAIGSLKKQNTDCKKLCRITILRVVSIPRNWNRHLCVVAQVRLVAVVAAVVAVQLLLPRCCARACLLCPPVVVIVFPYTLRCVSFTGVLCANRNLRIIIFFPIFSSPFVLAFSALLSASAGFVLLLLFSFFISCASFFGSHFFPLLRRIPCAISSPYFFPVSFGSHLIDNLGTLRLGWLLYS